MDLHKNHLLIGLEERINNDLRQGENINADIVGFKGLMVVILAVAYSRCTSGIILHILPEWLEQGEFFTHSAAAF